MKAAYKITPFRYAVPLCTTPEDYAGWSTYARMAPPGHAGFCEDCTYQYQQRKIIEGTCERPNVRFRRDIDGFLEGYIPSPTKEIA